MKNLTPLIFVAFILYFITSCSGPGPASPVEKSLPSTAAIEETRIGWEQEWEKILREARKEGKVTVFSGVGGEVRTLLTGAFRRKFNIELDYVTGRGGELTEKLFAERKAGLYLQDVGLFGAPTTITILKPANINEPLEKVLILPEVLDKKAWLEGEFKWLDRERLFLAYISSVRVSHYVNSALVNPDELRSYSDLINPKWKRKITMDDPTVTGTGNNWVAMVGDKIMGWDFMRAIANQEPVLLRDSHLQATWLIRGKYPIAIAPKPDIVQEFRNAGVEMVGILPAEGTYTTVGGGSVALFKNAPHPFAARVFINWLLTREGQTLYSKGYGWPSRRVDVPAEGLDPLVIPKPGVKYLNSDEEEYILARPKFMELAKEIFRPLIK